MLGLSGQIEQSEDDFQCPIGQNEVYLKLNLNPLGIIQTIECRETDLHYCSNNDVAGKGAFAQCE